jgi:hypothetical protein
LDQSDKELVNTQLDHSSDQRETLAVLSPLTGLALESEGELIEVDPPEPSRKGKKKEDPFDKEFEDAPEADSNAESPEEPPSPLPEPPLSVAIMSTNLPTNLLGTCPTFKGKRKTAKEFIANLELYFMMNKNRINSNKIKILLTLQHIGEDARQWKENKQMDLSSTASAKSWDNWTSFKNRFLENWEEIDSPGNMYTALLNLYK